MNLLSKEFTEIYTEYQQPINRRTALEQIVSQYQDGSITDSDVVTTICDRYREDFLKNHGMYVAEAQQEIQGFLANQNIDSNPARTRLLLRGLLESPVQARSMA